MPTVGIVEHRVRGRVRIRIPSKRHDLPFFEEVVTKINAHPNVHHSRASAYTGSVVIHHSGNADEILSLAADLIELSPEDRTLKELETVAEQSGLPLPALLDATAVVTGGFGVYRLTRRQDLGTASENFWAAFGSYRFLNSPALAALFAGLGLLQLLRGEVLGSATSLLYYSLLARQIAEFERTRTVVQSGDRPAAI